VLGGRLDSDEQIKRERTLESDEVTFFESILAHEEPSIFGEMGSSIGGGGGNNTNSLTSRLDPLEEILNVRLIDCREPKIPHDQFINEVANKHIDIQHDYVEYIQQLQLQEHQRILNGNNAANSRAIAGATQSSKKNIFSFLNNPFFLTLSKKNLGLYYDNKIKMMRERRNNIMMSLLEGSMPNPYFKMRLSRQNLLVDALSLIELQEQENPAILRKQLFIEFENEQGIDQGGVSKEFFQLAIDELLNKGYSKRIFLFIIYWFNY
jgi:ubiquitin-protein ligase E3 A